jgi:hypothetical protein
MTAEILRALDQLRDVTAATGKQKELAVAQHDSLRLIVFTPTEGLDPLGVASGTGSFILPSHVRITKSITHYLTCLSLVLHQIGL